MASLPPLKYATEKKKRMNVNPDNSDDDFKTLKQRS